MNLGQFLQTLIATTIGTLLGGFVVIFTNWLSAQRTRRENIQDRYIQTYITEGVDPLITFFVDIAFRWKWNEQRLMSLDDVPVAALAKIQVLLDSDVLTWIARDIQNFLAGKEIDADTQLTLVDLGNCLIDLHKELLKIIPTQVNEKSYQVVLPGFNQKFETIHRKLSHQNLENRRKGV